MQKKPQNNQTWHVIKINGKRQAKGREQLFSSKATQSIDFP